MPLTDTTHSDLPNLGLGSEPEKTDENGRKLPDPLKPDDFTVAFLRHDFAEEETLARQLLASDISTVRTSVGLAEASDPGAKVSTQPRAIDSRDLPLMGYPNRRGKVPEYLPENGPIRLLIFGDYPGSGSLLTGIPYWGDGPISRMVLASLAANRFCDEETVEMGQHSAAELAEKDMAPAYRQVALTYISDQLREGRVCSIEDITTKKNLERLRNIIETSIARCPMTLRIVTLGATAKFTLRALLYGRDLHVDAAALQSPSVGVGKPCFDEDAWINWARDAMRLDDQP